MLKSGSELLSRAIWKLKLTKVSYNNTATKKVSQSVRNSIT